MNSMMDWRTAPLMPQGVEHLLLASRWVAQSSDAVRRFNLNTRFICVVP